MSSSSRAASVSVSAPVIEDGQKQKSEKIEREQTTGFKLAAPEIRVEKSRCMECGGSAELVCKTCRMETVFCKKCARRSKHSHPLKAFRRRDEDHYNLRKHLTLSYFDHIVSCKMTECMETCLESRYARTHFATCPIRPRHILQIVHDGMVNFDETNCMTCGLFITCVFLHADVCRSDTCDVAWCEQIRSVFELGREGQPVFRMSKVMEEKCREVHREEWGKVERRRHDRMLEEMMAIEL